MNTTDGLNTANGTTAPASGIGAAGSERGRRTALAATMLVSGGLLICGLGLAAGTAQAVASPAQLYHYSDEQYQISDGLLSPAPLQKHKNDPVAPTTAPKPPPQPDPPHPDGPPDPPWDDW